jgi:hypothetical protein
MNAPVPSNALSLRSPCFLLKDSARERSSFAHSPDVKEYS